MSNHVATITKDEGRCSFSRKALSVFMAVLLAFLMMPMVPAESAFAADDSAIFGNAKPEYTVNPVDGVSTLTYTGAPVNMYFKSIVSDQTTDAYVLGTDYQVRYFEDTNNDGVLNAGDERLDGANGGAEWGKVPPVAVGNYFIVAMDNAAWANFAEELNTDGAAIDATDKFLTDNVQKDYGVICQYFKVVPQDFSGVSVYEVNPLNDEDTSDTTFVYNGKAIVANVSLGGADLHYGTDYTVSCGGVALAQVAGGFQLPINKSGATQAGTYDLVVTPHGAYTNYGQAKLTVTVGKLDLSEADVFAGDRQYDSFDSGKWYDSVSINGTDFAELMDEVNLVQYQYTDRQGDQFGIGDIGYLDLDVQENVNPGDGTAAIGGYDYTVKANPRSKNVNGETTVTIDVVTDLVDEAFYGSEYFADALDGETFYGDVWAFDASAIKLAEGGAPYTGKFTTTVTDANGTEVEAVANAGRYTVTVEVVPAADNYATGGTFRASFTYFRGQVDTASVEAVATIDGANVPFGTIYGDDEPAPNGRVYDGTAVEPKITVKAGDATLAEGHGLHRDLQERPGRGRRVHGRRRCPTPSRSSSPTSTCSPTTATRSTGSASRSRSAPSKASRARPTPPTRPTATSPACSTPAPTSTRSWSAPTRAPTATPTPSSSTRPGTRSPASPTRPPAPSATPTSSPSASPASTASSSSPRPPRAPTTRGGAATAP